MNALPATIRPRVGQLVRLLGSNHDGEVVGAARAIGRTLKANRTDWHSLAAAIEVEPTEKVVVVYRDRPVSSREPQCWRDLASWCRDNDRGRLADHERAFVRDMVARLILRGEPTDKQAAWLRGLYAKLGGGA